MGAERFLPGALAAFYALRRLEPLAIVVDQGNERHRYIADRGSDRDQVVIGILSWRIEDPVGVERGLSRRLVGWHRRSDHRGRMPARRERFAAIALLLEGQRTR